ncbi:MAG: aminotransferase class I/II-fold pyridoxal phosphate-dependent enzyme [Pirellulaceae bacterium]|nr:aminotransferase class I/II-fold pyridoxal phosphate-dependent enzyme [Pirellulaceae bacterium]
MPNPDDLCPRPLPLPQSATIPHAPPIWPASVWECESPQQADDMLGGAAAGYVYQRDGHPNAHLLAEKCRQLHGAERAAVTATGMGALAAALLSQMQTGDHAVVGSRVYGKTLTLFGIEASRLGISMTAIDTCDLAATERAITPQTKLLLAETIANPLLEVADIAALAEIAHRKKVTLLIDNTFASPIVCRPLELGADLVMESLTKTMNGHSDVILGLLCGRAAIWPRVPAVLSAWGLASSPFDCWLAQRGLSTAHLRIERGCENALAAAEFLLSQSPVVDQVAYPGLPSHPQHELARRQFGERFGTIVAFRLSGGRPAADRFICGATKIPFCPSLGELSTTLSHPETTSHRGLTAEQRAALGITGGTIRLSVGTESAPFIRDALAEGLRAAGG